MQRSSTSCDLIRRIRQRQRTLGVRQSFLQESAAASGYGGGIEHVRRVRIGSHDRCSEVERSHLDRHFEVGATSMELPSGQERQALGKTGPQERMSKDDGVAVTTIDADEIESLPGDQCAIDDIGGEQPVQQIRPGLGHERACGEHLELGCVEAVEVGIDERGAIRAAWHR